MAAITYCVRADVESIMSAVFVERRTDDDEDGFLSEIEISYITDAIERAATVMNATLEMRYSLASLAGNDWCKWCNATIAAVSVAGRRGNNIPASLAAEYDGYRDSLKLIKNNKLKVPQVGERFGPSPMVSNMKIELGRTSGSPVRVDLARSTGPRGSEFIKRFTS